MIEPAAPWQARATLRLAALLALAVTLMSLAAMGLQYRLIDQRLTEATQAQLVADLDGFAALYDQRRIIALRQAIEYRSAVRNPGELLVLKDRNGVVLAGSQTGWPDGLQASGDGFAAEPGVSFTHGGARWLGVARILPGGFPLLVARSLASVDETLAALRRGMAALAVALMAAGALTGWLAARSVMARLGRINDLADRVAAGDLAARLPGPRSTDEFGLLESHVHAMLDRIEALNRATHRLSDTIAHELRTPLNRMMQKLARIEGQEALTAELRDEMRQAVRVFDALLDISRAEADQGNGGGLVPVELSAVTREVWELYEPLAEDKGLVTRLDVIPGLQILGDRTLIGQMIANLLDNSIKYCAAGDGITLSLHPGKEHHRMCIQDTGPGLPAEIKAEAFERFTRADRDRAIAGHGLGLALVRAIATRHGARLGLPVVEKGFVLEIDWPKLAT
ncbi:MAG: HAMP domain-containing sensor histidine kinase [Cypionkella sp.]|nr:HAMP domain-containing histidine kinase [Cypionkella sp.]